VHRESVLKSARVLPRLIAGVVISLTLALPAFALETFTDEAKAQQHCPKDVVVWLNLPTMIWHYKGQRWYANTKHGAYACEKEAGAAGARGTRNGQ
jgi:hypothetical protein